MYELLIVIFLGLIFLTQVLQLYLMDSNNIIENIYNSAMKKEKKEEEPLEISFTNTTVLSPLTRKQTRERDYVRSLPPHMQEEVEKRKGLI